MSQFDEDKHIAAVLDEIGNGSKVLADIGARYEGSNSTMLIKRGFTGVLIDASAASCEELRQKCKTMKVIHARVTVDNINALVPKDAWFVSIDVDGDDWWLFANMLARPALVVIETNPFPGMYVVAIGAEHGKHTYGCSIEAVRSLGEMKGYDYIGRTEVNAFLVRKDLACKYRLTAPKGHSGMRCDGLENVMR